MPEVDEDEEEDPNEVVALEWDPLSLDYLLMSNTTTGIRLVDSVSHGVIMQFQLPTAAAKVKTLSWVTTAPGMFLTGGEYFRLNHFRFIKILRFCNQ